MSFVTVAAKIPRRLKELLDKYGVKPAPVIRRALEEEVKRKILSEAKKDAERLREALSYLTDEEVAELIREDRER